MSAVIKTLTPFTEQDLLEEALGKLGVGVSVRGQTLVTSRVDDWGQQSFVWNGKTYQLVHDSDESWTGSMIINSMHRKYTPVKQFLRLLETEYKAAYTAKLERIAEAERQRLEQERLARVEAARVEAIEKARAQGYQVKEQRANGKIQLVLTRTVS